MNTTRFLFAALVLIVAARCSAQDAIPADLDEALRARIHVLARGGDDGVILRWAVDKAVVWKKARTTGFIVERAEADARGAAPANAFRPLMDGPLLPWTAAQWQAYFSATPRPPEGVTDYPLAAAALTEGAETGARIDPGDLAALTEARTREDMRFGFALYAADRNASAAEGLGLRYVDRTATRGKTYVYRVRLAAAAAPYRVDTGRVTVKNDPYVPKRNALLRATENDGWILLTWPRTVYSSARVERSTDRGATFTALTRTPQMTVRAPGAPDEPEAFADTLVTNYRPYVYRVYGSTAFADEELIGEVSAMGRDRTAPGAPFVPGAKHTAARAVRITWSMEEPVAADLAGFRVLRDTKEDGPYSAISPVLGPGAREFIDTTFNDADANYYIVAARDTAGNIARSLPSYVALIDSTPPMAPRWVRGSMDSTGRVTLTLRVNPERDVMGYRILRANAPEHEFSSILERFGDGLSSAARDTVVYDTVEVRTLTKNVYYRATALDMNFNESDVSDMLVVPRPDLVPPVAPVITDVDVTDSLVFLRYTPGGSDDVAAHVVFRRTAGEAEWTTLRRLGPADTELVDRDVQATVTYEYTLQAVDSAGNRSELSMSVRARPYDSGVLPTPRDLQAVYNKETRRISVRWTSPVRREGLSFLVYRSFNGEGLKKYAAVAAEEKAEYIDTALRGKGTYEYAIRVVHSSGAESPLSDVIRVVVE
ncbi:MAG: hypothetical protein HY962_06260 [Ignavibacteriae bacterium]|nr:hypothetical protein [Ignavibacteriota bacterium]